MRIKLLLFCLIQLFSLSVLAVCKETDEFGNVSYVDCAQAETEDATPVDIPPANTVAPREYIPERPRRSEPSVYSPNSDRKKLRAAKERELKAAKEALAKAREVREGDRQGTVSGTRLTEQYLQRVKKAEERVKRAEESLK